MATVASEEKGPQGAMGLPGAVVCLMCGLAAPAWARLAVRPCGGWAEVLPPRVAAWLAGRRFTHMHTLTH
eukprot:2931796-Lingulodinium_polyedra.AAC.1